MDTQKIGVRRFPVQVNGPLIWVYIAKDAKDTSAPKIDPPDIAFLTGVNFHSLFQSEPLNP